MIKLVASTLLAHFDPQRDFIGHVGGDDFLLVLQDDTWQARCEQIVEKFNRAAVLLYDDSARAAGGVDSEDRCRNPCFFEFTTLYIGAVVVSGGQFEHAERVANAAARAKQAAKMGDLGLVVHRGHKSDSGFVPLTSH